MISYEQALKFIFKNTSILPIRKAVVVDSVGQILAENIYSPLEMPPFNKSAMDGYAVKVIDVKNIPSKLKCIGRIQAGEIFNKKVFCGECVKVMTGACLPKGTDTVVMIEHTRATGDYIEIRKPVKKWQNVCFQGEDLKKGQQVFEKGRIISISDIALLATVNRKYIKVIRKPEVAVLSTGGEIVPSGTKLRFGKTYNSNGPQLMALLKANGLEPCFLGITKDKSKELTGVIKKGLKKDMLLISGGVSMGDYDLVPDILIKLGVKEIFHNVNIKPCKPLFFGKKKNTIIFGIPGNPVSNFLAYIIFIRPALYKMMGYKNYRTIHNSSFHGPVWHEGITTEDFYQKSGRKHFVLVKVVNKNNRYYVCHVDSHGSADILSLSKANGFMVVEEDKIVVKKNSKVDFIMWGR